MAVPSTMATSVVISSRALARERSRSETISGTMPYLAGLNTVECTRHQEQHHEHPRHVGGEEGEDAQRHGGDLEGLDADQHVAFADGVGQVAGVAGEEQRGQHEDGGGQR